MYNQFASAYDLAYERENEIRHSAAEPRAPQATFRTRLAFALRRLATRIDPAPASGVLPEAAPAVAYAAPLTAHYNPQTRRVVFVGAAQQPADAEICN